jgi:hypothetical protein
MTVIVPYVVATRPIDQPHIRFLPVACCASVDFLPIGSIMSGHGHGRTRATVQVLGLWTICASTKPLVPAPRYAAWLLHCTLAVQWGSLGPLRSMSQSERDP